VQFIDDSGFVGLELDSISIEAGNDIFHIEYEFLLDIVCQKLIHNFAASSNVKIPRTIDILGSSCFSYCESFSSMFLNQIPN
jgi:hypothetical protein